MQNDKMVEKLKDLPKIIKEAKEQRYELFLEKNEIVDRLSYHEAQIKDEILNEVDEKDKKKYSNETSRKNEFDKRSKIDENYSNDIKKMRELDRNITMQNIEIEYYEDIQRNYRAIFNYGANS